MDNITIRAIRPEDNTALAGIVRNTLVEFGARLEGTVYYDPTTDDLFGLFQAPGATYFTAEKNGKVLGGGGIFPTKGLPEDTCELVKMYLLPEARGTGLGKKLITLCLDAAREKGYKKVYLETMPELKQALQVYARFGFEYLSAPMGNSGHFGCQLWMLKKLE